MAGELRRPAEPRSLPCATYSTGTAPCRALPLGSGVNGGENRALALTLMRHAAIRLLRASTATPEFNLAVFALLLNFPWEVLQAPLFEGMATAPHSAVIGSCLRATLGDTVIVLLAHASVAAVTRRRHWVLAPSWREVAGFAAVGVAITTVIEWLATRGHWAQTWVYSSAMPLIPGIEIGLSPLLQWVIVPPIALWFVRRQSERHGAVDEPQ